MAAIGSVQIKVSTDVLNAKAQSVSKSITAMENCFEELGSIVSRTSNYWIGDAGEQHRKMYNNQKSHVDEMMARLKEHPRDLLTISQTYVAVEQAVTSLADSLAGDVIE
jgi:WXG100 family type VII secretion target